MGTASQLLASKLLRHFNMKPLILLGLVAFVRAQYSGETQDLSNSQLDALKDIFGDAAAGGAYSGQRVGRLEGGTNGVEAIIQVVKNEEGYVAPDDYQTTAGLTDKATTNVDNVFENCADYTATQGYECVPYYQCHNGTIITDGGGLIDIRNGFGILSPEDSKCPGFLDVCCLDPDFIPPPPPPIVKHVPKCGQRHENGLGVRIQGFNEYESQFGEWPHMCAVLAEEPVAQDPGYAGEPQTVNLYQCGGSLIAPGVILTAAHCAAKFQQEPTKLKIRWGKDQFGAAGNYQVVLKEIDLPVVGHDQCEASLRTTRLGKRFQLDDSFICAGGVDGKDTCKGDGGSPLVCQSKFDPTSYVQAGIVAWDIGCGEDNTPGVYASVSKGVCWIDYAMTCQFGQQSGSYSSYWGYSAQQCQTWMDGELSRLNQEVADMQNAGSLTGRKKAAALAKGLKAQETLNKYSQCNVFWQPNDAAPLTTGGNGYVDGGDVDISGFERKGSNVAQPSDSSAVKLTQGSSY